MAYTTIVTGTSISSSWANADVRDQVVTPFASVAARSSAITSPVTGMVSTLTTNDSDEGVEVYNSNGDWNPPWNLPWGVKVAGYASTTSNSSGTTSTTDWSGLSVTWTANTNRLYMVCASASVGSTSSGEVVSLLIADGSNNQKKADAGYINSASYGVGLSPILVETGLSGSVTRKVRVSRITAIGTVTGAAASTAPAQIVVFDLGPVGAPS